MGGERHGNYGNANAYHATSGGGHPPATAAAVAAKRGSGNGKAGNGGGRRSFEKFTVSVRGRQWSWVRYVNETLEEFAAAIACDARRLAFGDNDDSIRRLQLESSDGFELNDQDVDATFSGEIICMGDEQVLAIVKQHLPIVESTQLTPPRRMSTTGTPKQRSKSECTPHLTNAIARNWHDSVAAPSSSPDLLDPTAAQKFPFPDNEPPCSAGLTTNPRVSKNYIPPESPSLQYQPAERVWSFQPDYADGAGANLPPLPRSSDKLNIGGACKPDSGPSELQQQFGNPTPSPAELPSFASCGFNKAPKVNNPVANAITDPVSSASPACNLQAEQESRPDPGVQEIYLGAPNHPGGANNAKRSPSGVTSHGNSKEKSPSSSNSSANVRYLLASPTGDGEGLDNKLKLPCLPNGVPDLVFPVHRRKKTELQGVGTHYLKMSDIPPLFPLKLIDAAKKLGVSQTTFKKACREFGLGRWPGRKVRSLMQGHSQERVVRQGTDLKKSTEAYMRSKVRKLKQEMDVHGTPAQVTQRMHSPAVRTAGLDERLSSPGGRSDYHSAGRHDDMTTLDTGNPTKRDSGLVPPTTRKYRKTDQQRKGPYSLRK